MVSPFNETLHLRSTGIRNTANGARNSGGESTFQVPARRNAMPATQAKLPVFESRTLFGGTNEVGIVHEGALYRLKTTKQGKLVLNK